MSYGAVVKRLSATSQKSAEKGAQHLKEMGRAAPSFEATNACLNDPPKTLEGDVF